MAKSKFRLLVAFSTVAFAMTSFNVSAFAGTKRMKNPTITMKSGNKAGLHYLYAWDQNCKPVSVSFKALKAKKGRLYTLPGRFKISRKQSKKCAGKSIRGKKVVFKANKKATGKTTVQYRIASKNTKHSYIVSRSIRLK